MDKPNIIKPDLLSLSTHHIHLCFEDKVLASGTAFAYKFADDVYLITNWHNVAGKHPQTKKCLRDDAAVPNKLSTLFRRKDEPGASHRETLDLYEDNKSLINPLWLEHPNLQENVDVVAIKVTDEIVDKYKIFPINENSFDDDIEEEIADEIFVIGYPFSETPYLQLPIWKKASIASEPTVNTDQLPKFLIDTATRRGFSGSPVIMQRTGIHRMGPNGEMRDTTMIGRIRNFVGVYSGRIDDAELKAQLGIVWKKKVIEEIISGSQDRDMHQ